MSVRLDPSAPTVSYVEEAIIEQARLRQKRRRKRSMTVVLAALVAGLVVAAIVGPGRRGGVVAHGRPSRPRLAPMAGPGSVVPRQPGPMAVSATGALLVADDARDEILQRRPDGSFRVFAGDGRVGYAGSGGPALKAELHGPEGMAVAGNGTVYFADSGNDRVRAVLPDGTLINIAGDGRAPSNRAQVPSPGHPATQTAIGTPFAVAISPSGDLYIAVQNAVLRVTATGTGDLYIGCFDPWALVERTPTSQEIYRGALRPHDAFAALAPGPDGTVLATAGNQLVSYSSTGRRLVASFDRLANHSLFWPQGIAAAGNGTVYLDQDGVSGIGQPLIIARSSDGTLRTIWSPTTARTSHR